LRNEFESRTGGVWALNVGQVYTTLARLERDGLVERRLSDSDEKLYAITREGRARLEEWFSKPAENDPPNRDELVLKLILALHRSGADAARVIQAERKAIVQLLQEYTKAKMSSSEDELGWLCLIDSLIFQAEARIRWLDACEERLKGSRVRSKRATAPAQKKEALS
jgi:DNA-binding PadR family transcriptional regulator